MSERRITKSYKLQVTQSAIASDYRMKSKFQINYLTCHSFTYICVCKSREIDGLLLLLYVHRSIFFPYHYLLSRKNLLNEPETVQL